jgi:hypothetical protein
MNRLILAAVLTLALGATGAWAQAPADDPHHPPAGATPMPVPPQPPAGQSGTGGQRGMMGNMPMNMTGMMRDMPMANMMGMMQMMGHDPAGMGAIDHIEGRIAFLHTELKITDAQATAWKAFADALRANAKKLGEARASMMSRMSAGQQQPLTLADRLDLQERWLTARLEGTRALKSTFAILNASLSDDQKKTAGEILAPHMGMGMAAMMGL